MMRKLLIILMFVPFLCGCWVYGEGTTVGYVTTVEAGIFWDTVWIRADMASSQTNAYAIRKSERELKNNLIKTAEEHKKVEIKFMKHVNMARCGDNVNSDEIISYKVLD